WARRELGCTAASRFILIFYFARNDAPKCRGRWPRRPMAAAAPSRLATADWYDKLIQSEQSGDGLNEKCIRFVWSGSVVAYCNGRADGFSRHAFPGRR